MINVNEIVKEFGNKETSSGIKFATIDLSYTTGDPKLLFDGETNVSTKGYSYLKNYSIVAGERVIVINGVVIGAISD